MIQKYFQSTPALCIFAIFSDLKNDILLSHAGNIISALSLFPHHKYT